MEACPMPLLNSRLSLIDSRRFLLLLTLPLFSLVSAASNSTCYWPSGDVATPYFACNPNSAVSACCYENEYCLDSGLCYSPDGFNYRGTCTDSTWGSQLCPQQCLTGASNRSGNMLLCGAGKYTCVADPDQNNACKNNYPRATIIPGVGGAAAFGSSSSLPSPSVSRSSSSPQASTPSAAQSSGSACPTAAAIVHANGLTPGQAAGLGVGLAIPLLAAAAFFAIAFWRERRAKRKLEEWVHSQGMQWGGAGGAGGGTTTTTTAYWQQHNPQIHQTILAPQEIDTREKPYEMSQPEARTEAPADNGRAGAGMDQSYMLNALKSPDRAAMTPTAERNKRETVDSATTVSPQSEGGTPRPQQGQQQVPAAAKYIVSPEEDIYVGGRF